MVFCLKCGTMFKEEGEYFLDIHREFHARIDRIENGSSLAERE